MEKKTNCNSILSTYRGLDLTNNRGWLCGKILADLGMDIIKVEPLGGDPGRFLGPYFKDDPDPEKSLNWWAFNTSKRSITLEIDTEKGRDDLLDLVRKSDFIIESFEPGYMKKLGLDYETLSQINPGIIMVSITGFGQEGPYSGLNAPDIVVAALGGYMNLTGDPDRPPLRNSIPQHYLHASNDAATAALIALWHRENTGLGQWVDTSAQECTAWLGFSNYVFWDFTGTSPSRANLEHNRLSVNRETISDIFQCRDGYVLFTSEAGRNGHRTRRFVEWMEEEGKSTKVLSEYPWEEQEVAPPDLTEEELEQWVSDLVETYTLLRQNFEPFILTKTKKELFEQAFERGILLAPLNTIKEVVEDVHFKERGFWQTADHPSVNEKIEYPGSPFSASKFSSHIRRPAPGIGEHNQEILEKGLERTDKKIKPMPDTATAQGEAFKGLKILDFTWVTVGPRTVRYFADHGATVVKIEAPERPDIGRIVPPHKDGIFDADRSGWFALYNINKLGMTVDMATPEGLALVKRLVEWADVLMESFRPGVMKKFGLDYDSVKKLNPNIIYASTSMFGHTGPYTNFAGFGHHAASVTGYYNIVGWPDRAPCGAFWAYTDNIAPQFLASAITTALIHRQKTGEGVYIEQSQNETAMQLLSPYLLDYSINGRIWNRCGNQDAFMAPHGAYPCLGDDRWCAIAVTSEDEWTTLCEMMDKPDLVDDVRFCTLQARKENEDELNRIISDWTAQIEAKTLMNRLLAKGVAAGLVATAEDMHHDPQFKYRRTYYSIDHPVIGPHPVNALPFRLSRTPAQVYRQEPCLGEHNSYVCTDILNMSDEEFVALLEADAFGSLE